MDLESLIVRVECLAEILNRVADDAFGRVKPLSEFASAEGVAAAAGRELSMICFLAGELCEATRGLYPAFEEARKESRL